MPGVPGHVQRVIQAAMSERASRMDIPTFDKVTRLLTGGLAAPSYGVTMVEQLPGEVVKIEEILPAPDGEQVAIRYIRRIPSPRASRNVAPQDVFCIHIIGKPDMWQNYPSGLILDRGTHFRFSPLEWVHNPTTEQYEIFVSWHRTRHDRSGTITEYMALFGDRFIDLSSMASVGTRFYPGFPIINDAGVRSFHASVNPPTGNNASIVNTDEEEHTIDAPVATIRLQVLNKHLHICEVSHGSVCGIVNGMSLRYIARSSGEIIFWKGSQRTVPIPRDACPNPRRVTAWVEDGHLKVSWNRDGTRAEAGVQSYIADSKAITQYDGLFIRDPKNPARAAYITTNGVPSEEDGKILVTLPGKRHPVKYPIGHQATAVHGNWKDIAYEGIVVEFFSDCIGILEIRAPKWQMQFYGARGKLMHTHYPHSKLREECGYDHGPLMHRVGDVMLERIPETDSFMAFRGSYLAIRSAPMYGRKLTDLHQTFYGSIQFCVRTEDWVQVVEHQLYKPSE